VQGSILMLILRYDAESRGFSHYLEVPTSNKLAVFRFYVDVSGRRRALHETSSIPLQNKSNGVESSSGRPSYCSIDEDRHTYADTTADPASTTITIADAAAIRRKFLQPRCFYTKAAGSFWAMVVSATAHAKSYGPSGAPELERNV